MAGRHYRRRTHRFVNFTKRLIVPCVAALVVLAASGDNTRLTKSTADAERSKPSVMALA